jgi:hypothetical protein
MVSWCCVLAAPDESDPNRTAMTTTTTTTDGDGDDDDGDDDNGDGTARRKTMWTPRRTKPRRMTIMVLLFAPLPESWIFPTSKKCPTRVGCDVFV